MEMNSDFPPLGCDDYPPLGHRPGPRRRGGRGGSTPQAHPHPPRQQQQQEQQSQQQKQQLQQQVQQQLQLRSAHDRDGRPGSISGAAGIGTALFTFRNKVFALLCKESPIPTNELITRYRAANLGEFPDALRLGFSNLSSLLRAIPEVCTVTDVVSGPTVKQFVKLADKWQHILMSLERKREEICDAGQQVTSGKLLRWLESEMDMPLRDLGMERPFHFPYLKELHKTEADVEICISCFLADLMLAGTIFDLERFICKTTNVTSYEQLRLGPLLGHRMVQHYWKPAANLTRVPKVSLVDCAAALKAALLERRMDEKRLIKPEDVERQLVKSKGASSIHELGVVITDKSLGWAVSNVNRAGKEERDCIEKAVRSSEAALLTQIQVRIEARRAQLESQAKANFIRDVEAKLRRDKAMLRAAKDDYLERKGLLEVVPKSSDRSTQNTRQPLQPLDASMLATASPDKQKQMIREHLHQLVSKLQPRIAGMVTGMLLEMDNAELLMVLDDNKMLRTKVDEAMTVLEGHGVTISDFEDMEGEHSTQSFNIQQPAKPVISLEELAAVAARLAASCASTPVGLAKLEQDVLSHFDAAPHFLALGAGCTSLLDMMHKCPHFAEVLNATWGTSDVRPGAVARKDVSKDQLLRATAQAAAAYRATHSVAQQQLGGPGSVNDEEVLYVEQALRVQFGLRSEDSVEQLGWGPTTQLLQLCSDHVDTGAALGVVAAGALMCGMEGAATEMDVVPGRSNADLGAMAQAALASAPMLTDLVQWSQWGSVFERELGPLDGELLADAMAACGSQWAVLALPDNKQMIKVPANASLWRDFEEGLEQLNPAATVAALLGCVVQEGHCGKAVLESLASSVTRHFNNEAEFHGGKDNAKGALCSFVLHCMQLLPDVVRPRLTQHVLLTPLIDFMHGDVHAATSQILHCACAAAQQEQQQLLDGSLLGVGSGGGACGSVGGGSNYGVGKACNMKPSQLLPILHQLGMQLGVPAWMEHYATAVWDAGAAAIAGGAAGGVDANQGGTNMGASMKVDGFAEGVANGSVADAALKAQPGSSPQAHQVDSGMDKSLEVAAAAEEGGMSDQGPIDGAPHAFGEAAGGAEGSGTMAPQLQHCGGSKELEVGELAAKEAEALAFLQWLRRKRFYLDMDLTEEMQGMKAVTEQMFGGLLQTLSVDLYSEDNHFLMELIQNADDCKYNTSTPGLRFEVHADRILVKSNEVGFNKDNVKAICAMGQSPKANEQGYIGQKGIGFKSVFVITDTPAIHSNGFHFKFDVNLDPKFGYIVPIPVAPLPIEQHNVQETATCFDLPLKLTFQGKTSKSTELRASFSSISPLLLLFLRKLRRISVYDAVAQKELRLLKWQDSANPNCVHLHAFTDSSQLTTKWLLVKRVLHFDPPIKRRKIDVSTTGVSLAFYLPTGENDNEQPDKQYVYAYLPTRKFGFKFVVQGDWDVPANRQDIFNNNEFNLALRKAIPDLGMEALEHFKRLPSPRPERPYFWIDWWLRCLPLDNEVEDLFALPARQLRMSAMGTPCIPDHLGVLVCPTHAYVCTDANMSALMAEPRACKLLDVHFVHPDIRCMYASGSRVRQQLHVKRFATPELLHWARKVCETGILQELGMPWLAQLLVCVFHNLQEVQDQERARMLASLRCLPILPLMDGTTVSMCSGNSSSKGSGSVAQPAHADASSAAGHAQQQQQQQQQVSGPVFFPLQCSVQAMEARAAESDGAAAAAAVAGTAGSVDTEVDGASSATGPGSESVPEAPGRAQRGDAAATATAARGPGSGKSGSSSTTTKANSSASASVKCTRAEKLLLDVGLDWCQMGLQQLHPDLFQVEQGKAQKLRNGLAELGVRDLSHEDVLQLHVLPLFRRYKERITLVQQEQQQQQQQQRVSDPEARQLAAALTYVVASGLMQDPTVCAQVRECAVVLTNRGLCHIPSHSPTVYLPPELGNAVVDLPARFPSHNWLLVSSPDYLNSSIAAQQISAAQWGAAFAQLGAQCWLPLHRSVVTLDKAGWQERLAAASMPAAAAEHSTCNAPTIDPQMAFAQVHDAFCPEFAQLLASLTAALRGPPVKGTPPLQQLRHLARTMEGLWHAAGYAACMSVPATPLAAPSASVQQQQQQEQEQHSEQANPAAGAAAGAAAANVDAGNCAAKAATSAWEGPRDMPSPAMLVPSAFALALRNSAWLLSNADEPAKPTSLFWEPAYKVYLTSKVPYVRHDSVQSREVLSALGVHMQLSLREALGLLIEWATGSSGSHDKDNSSSDVPVSRAGASSARPIKGPDGKVINCSPSADPAPLVLEGNCFRTSLEQMGALYAFIAREAQQGQDAQAVQAAQFEIVAAFSKHPLLWLPPKLAERPPPSTAEVDGSFVSTACARHLDRACVMEAIPWERQHLRIMGRFYNDASQALFLTPLWRPGSSRSNSAAEGGAAGPQGNADTDDAGFMGGVGTAGGFEGAAGAAGGMGGMGMDAADGMDAASEAGSEHGGDEDGEESAVASSDQDEEDSYDGGDGYGGGGGGGGSAVHGSAGVAGAPQQQQSEGEGYGVDAGFSDVLIKPRPSTQEYVDALVALAESSPDEMSFEAARGWVMKLFQWIESLSLSGKREMHCLLAPHIYVNSSLKAPRVFPTTRGQWASLQDMLYINDDSELQAHFADWPDVHFLHASEADRSRTYKRSIFLPFRAMGVPLLSTSVQPDTSQDASNYNAVELQRKVLSAVLCAQRFLFAKWKCCTDTHDTYTRLKQAGIAKLFHPPGRSPFTVVAAENLGVRYTLQPPVGHCSFDAVAQPVRTPRLLCGAMLCSGKMLFVNEKAGSFNTHAVGQQLSRLFDPPSVAKLLNPEPGAAPHSAPKRKDLTDFLDQVLLRMSMGQDLEEFLRQKECYELPAEEEPWLELPALCVSPPLTSATLHASADVDFPEEPEPQQSTAAAAAVGAADGQQQQQQEQQQTHVPKARSEFSASSVWAASQGLSRSDAPRQTQGEHNNGEASSSELASPQPKSRFPFARGDEVVGTGSSVGIEGGGEQVVRSGSGKGGQEVGRVGDRSELRDKQEKGAGDRGDRGEVLGSRGDVMGGGVRREGVAKEQEAKQVGAGGTPGASIEERAAPIGSSKVGGGPASAVAKPEGRVGGVRGSTGDSANGSLFFSGMGAGSGVDGIDGEGGAMVWQSAAEAEAAARRDGLMRDYDPSELQEVLRGLEHLPDAGIGPTHSTPEYLLAVGRWGERIVAKKLRHEVAGTGATVEWLNEEQESGRPYDILVTDAAGNKTYVEVKSTRAHRKDAFSISREELSWAHEAGYAYHIYRVTGAGTPSCWLSRIMNPVKLWTDKAIRLCLVL